MNTRTDGTQLTAELPDLDPGIVLVDIEADLGVTPVQALLVDRLLADDGNAYWVDTAGTDPTTRLRELAPNQRYLDRVQVARGFTVYQQTSLIDRLCGRLSGTDPTVVLATGVDRLYRDDDVPADRADRLFVRSIAALARVARIHEIPVVVTRAKEDAFSQPLVNAAGRQLRCQTTLFGPRFEGVDDDTETLVYHTNDGWMQTTLAYWQEVLSHRARVHEETRETTPMTPRVN